MSVMNQAHPLRKINAEFARRDSLEHRRPTNLEKTMKNSTSTAEF